MADDLNSNNTMAENEQKQEAAREDTMPKLKRAATKKRQITRPIAEIKPCSIYSTAADSITIPSIEDLQDSDEEGLNTCSKPKYKKKRPTRRTRKPPEVIHFDSDDDDVICFDERTPTGVRRGSPCSPPPPPDMAERRNKHDQLTSHLLRNINVTLTNVRCVQNEFSSDDAFSPIACTPGGSLTVIDVDGPQPTHIRNSITVKVRSRLGLHRFQLAMSDCFSGVIADIADIEGVSKDCVKLTRGEQDLTESDTPQSINLHIVDLIDCLIVDPGSNPGSQETVEVTLQGMEKNSSMTRTILRNDPLERLMEEYSAFCGHPVAKLKFSFDGDTVKPTDTPELLDFEEDTNTVDVHIFH